MSSSNESPPLKLDNSTTWQEKAQLALAESTKHHNDAANSALLAALNQLAESKGQGKDPAFESLMIFEIPDITNSEKYNPKKAEVMEKIFKKKLEICQAEFGENSVQNADALRDLFSFESTHDREQAKIILAEARRVNQLLKDNGTPYDTSEWNLKRDAHSESVTGIKKKQPTYAVATENIPAGAAITKDNTRDVSSPYSQHPPGALPGGGLLIGCRTVTAISKGSAVTTKEVCHKPGPLSWDMILPSDAKWIQASKLAMTSSQKNDYPTALKHYDELADQLTKLASEHKHLTDYCENCYLCTIMSYNTCAAEGGRKPLDRTRSLAWHKRVLAALTELCPEGNENILNERKSLDELKDFE